MSTCFAFFLFRGRSNGLPVGSKYPGSAMECRRSAMAVLYGSVLTLPHPQPGADNLMLGLIGLIRFYQAPDQYTADFPTSTVVENCLSDEYDNRFLVFCIVLFSWRCISLTVRIEPGEHMPIDYTHLYRSTKYIPTLTGSQNIDCKKSGI